MPIDFDSLPDDSQLAVFIRDFHIEEYSCEKCKTDILLFCSHGHYRSHSCIFNKQEYELCSNCDEMVQFYRDLKSIWSYIGLTDKVLREEVMPKMEKKKYNDE